MYVVGFAMIVFFLAMLTPFSADKVEIIKVEGVSIVHLIGSVVIEDEDTRITCREARLNETENHVILQEEVTITDQHGQIASHHAVYYFDTREGFMDGNVVLTTPDETIMADFLHYQGLSALVEMSGNVVVEDLKNDLTAWSSRGWYDLDADKGYLVEAPVLEIKREEKEPMRVKAREFRLHTNENEFFGDDSVVAIIDSITVFCDSFSYDLTEKTGTMVRPLVVDRQNELKGSTGQFMMRDNVLESFLVNDGWSRYFAESGSRNIVEGDTIWIYFREGKAVKIVVVGGPTGEVRMKEEEDAGD